ncbi:MAG: hypothetical protein ACP5PM_02970 [Acidimicrobiales bacterium]
MAPGRRKHLGGKSLDLARLVKGGKSTDEAGHACVAEVKQSSSSVKAPLDLIATCARL